MWFATGLVIALPLGLLAMRLMRRANPKGHDGWSHLALMLFLSPYFINTRDQDLIEETGNETKRKKDSQSGDPPDPAKRRRPEPSPFTNTHPPCRGMVAEQGLISAAHQWHDRFDFVGPNTAAVVCR